MTSGGSSVSIAEQVVLTRLADGEGVLLDPVSGRYVRLNKTALVIWSEIEEGNSIEAISRSLTERFDVTDAEARRAVESFIAQLADDELVTVLPSG